MRIHMLLQHTLAAAAKYPWPRINRQRMPNFLVGLLNAIEILWFKNLNSWSLLLTMRQGTQHSKNVVFKSKIYLWNPHWQLWKGKGFLHGLTNECAVYLFLKNGPTSASFSFIFGLFKQTLLQFLQQINVKNVMSIQYPAPGFEPTTFGTWVFSHNH